MSFKMIKFWDTVVEFATWAHRGQTRRDGTPYIQHPLAVSKLLTTSENTFVRSLYANMTEDEKIVLHAIAVVHDVCEDVPAARDKLMTIFEQIPDHLNLLAVEAINLLTHNKNQLYSDYIETIISSRNVYAVAVKLMDMEHNSSDLLKKAELTEKEKQQLNKYRVSTLRIMENYE